jgi:hypothetical protein
MKDMREELKKFAAENGLDASQVMEAAERIAVCKEIEKIAFRADTALFAEMSLVFDELSLAETPAERLKITKEKLRVVEGTMRAFHDTVREAHNAIMQGKVPAELPYFFTELAESEEADDDEQIMAYFLALNAEAENEVKEVLREYVGEAFKGDGDEC